MYNLIAKSFTLRGLIANSATFGSILCLAELTQESIDKWRRGSRNTPDVRSLQRHAFMGSCVIAPMLYTYYCWLDTRFPGKRMRTIAIKVANDVFIANIAYYGTFYYGMSYMEHKNHSKATHPKQEHQHNQALEIDTCIKTIWQLFKPMPELSTELGIVVSPGFSTIWN